jgi:PilZ domain
MVMSSFTTSSESEIRKVLEGVSAAQELVILATPYLRYESNFLGIEGDVVHARVTMGAEESMYGLRSPDLVMRFPDGARFLEGKTKLVGIGMLGGRRSLRLAIPGTLHDADHRRAYRVSRVPRVPVTFSTPKFDLRPATLVNLSTGGASLQVALAAFDNAMKEGDEVAVSIPLTEEIRIDSRAIVRWTAGKALGIEFKPPIQQPLLSPLSRWLFQRREEEKARLETLILPAIVGKPGAENGLVLVSSSEEVEAQFPRLPTRPGFLPMSRP